MIDRIRVNIGLIILLALFPIPGDLSCTSVKISESFMEIDSYCYQVLTD
jgi:hypothetical protein